MENLYDVIQTTYGYSIRYLVKKESDINTTTVLIFEERKGQISEKSRIFYKNIGEEYNSPY